MIAFLDSTIILSVSCLVVIYMYLKYKTFNYWKQHGVPYQTPLIPLGNIRISHFFGKINLGNMFKESYEKFKNHPFHGFYVCHRPLLIITDPELIRTILITEFSRFHDRGWYVKEHLDLSGINLVMSSAEKWKQMRVKLTPMFTSSKLKRMYSLVEDISNEMISTCHLELQKSDVLEIRDIMARYTTDIISSIMYGLECNSLKNPNSEFRRNGVKAVQAGKIKYLIAIFMADFLKQLSIPFMSYDVQNFFLTTLRDSVNYRRATKIVREDLLNLFVQLIDNGEVDQDESNAGEMKQEKKNPLTMFEAAGHAFFMFAAGYETSSSTATLCLLELALNPEIQDKLQEEVDEIADSVGLTYDSIMNMEYLDSVIQETLRKHPSVPFLDRVCVEDFKIPNSNYTIPKGMKVLIPISGLHHDPNIYPNPEMFDPTRFSQENSASKNKVMHLGFGDGPRFCIGKRFGLMQTKQAIATMLREFRFHVCKKTEVPVKFATDTFVQTPENGVYLRVEKRALQKNATCI